LDGENQGCFAGVIGVRILVHITRSAGAASE
jgi:hypothetical protein